MRTPRKDRREEVAAAARTAFADPSIMPSEVEYFPLGFGPDSPGWYWVSTNPQKEIRRIGGSIAACQRRARRAALDRLPGSKDCPRGCSQGMVLEIDPHHMDAVPTAGYRCQDCDDREELKP